MDFKNRPLLEGFLEEPDSVLIEAIIGQLDYAAFVSKKNPADGLHEDVKQAIRHGLTESKVSRKGLAKFLFFAIKTALDADRESRSEQGETK